MGFYNSSWERIFGIFPWLVLIAVVKFVDKPFNIFLHPFHIGKISLVNIRYKRIKLLL